MNTVLITGSSRGIGRETALVFAQNGWNVAIHGYRHPERLASLEQEIKRLGVQCLSFTGDICDSYFVEDVYKRQDPDMWYRVPEASWQWPPR